jgi:hypothetical protein
MADHIEYLGDNLGDVVTLMRPRVIAAEIEDSQRNLLAAIRLPLDHFQVRFEQFAIIRSLPEVVTRFGQAADQ